MEERETPRMLKYEESKTTRIMMATVRHVTSSSGLRKVPTDGFLSDSVHGTLLKTIENSDILSPQVKLLFCY
jgi:hypothetical protein